MFKKILIANRGEIACRVIRTARRMGIATVAVYSDADAHALHVKLADEAVPIGPAPSSQSYIVIDNILAAIEKTGADAVHPGYGFLSENPAFAAALEKADIAFIGPPVGAIEAMGDKITSKKIAADAGVSTVPGHMGLIDNADEAVRIAATIGYPVMIKASAGGGGKGMRIAWNDAEAREGFQSSRNEAKAAFGDDRIFIEKFVSEPRHIEIQVLGDRHGNTLHLGERECSIQRRNQKVIEEAPSPFLDEATRRAMGEQAVALARAVGYFSAGTVEFIVDGGRNFYFLEMNTRLQVEHPVTELVTGIDLVEQMIRIAAGERLSFAQKDVKLDGWAIESRLYAEDPYRNFLPSIGRLSRYRPPTGASRDDGCIIRNDTGVFEGGEISMHYDPMIAKLCAWAPDAAAGVAADAVPGAAAGVTAGAACDEAAGGACDEVVGAVAGTAGNGAASAARGGAADGAVGAARIGAAGAAGTGAAGAELDEAADEAVGAARTGAASAARNETTGAVRNEAAGAVASWAIGPQSGETPDGAFGRLSSETSETLAMKAPGLARDAACGDDANASPKNAAAAAAGEAGEGLQSARFRAIEAMSAALDAFELEGIGHNLPFLSAVMRNDRFRAGRLTTAFIAEEFPDGFAGVAADRDSARKLAAVAVLVKQAVEARAAQISGALGNHRRSIARDWVAAFAGFEVAVRLEADAGGASVRFDDGERMTVASGWLPGRTLADFHIDGSVMAVKVALIGSAIRLRWRGIDETVRVRSPRVAELARLMPVKMPPDLSKFLLCPMPGVVTAIAVKPGDAVEAGQTLATVEAMKMENVLKAERRGVVKHVAAEPGQSLAVEELILEFE